ncbi:DUF4422 domain-containing protein [Methanobrevibacter sp.]
MVNVKIYVATHKKYDKIKSDELFAPILVGAYKSEDDFGYLRDDVGDNISDRNIQYSELTGLYWVWKHASEDLLGLCHYRRYFSKSIFKSTQIIDKTDVLNALENHDFIVHERIYPISNGDWLKFFVDESFLEKSKQIFNQVHPEYFETLEHVYNSKKTYGYSCFITNKKLFDEYCEWLFSYLTVLEKELEGDRIRILGYYAEVLLSIFIIHNSLSVKKCPLYYVESKNNFVANCIDNSHILAKIFHTLQWKYVPKIRAKLRKKK